MSFGDAERSGQNTVIAVIAGLVGLGYMGFQFRHCMFGSAIGSPCKDASGCRSGECLTSGLLGTGEGVCTEDCSDGSACPTGFSCVDDKYCLAPGDKSIGEACAGLHDCASNICLGGGLGDGIAPFCSQKCEAEGDCQSEAQCVDTKDGKLCVPGHVILELMRRRSLQGY